ncbi:protein O-linked-mannose beta-1,2-N-acetylglucosaminyltransferase 1-like [Palaemon carinicauda]|uniref:protein O-linked-mannose beta-1,2-N-acetylglucosaminyltransferase 1-like n=1 Tax=Palaemon carinicauda TaxID=392227 RepID=UPI0035B5F9D1
MVVIGDTRKLKDPESHEIVQCTRKLKDPESQEGGQCTRKFKDPESQEGGQCTRKFKDPESQEGGQCTRKFKDPESQEGGQCTRKFKDPESQEGGQCTRKLKDPESQEGGQCTRKFKDPESQEGGQCTRKFKDPESQEGGQCTRKFKDPESQEGGQCTRKFKDPESQEGGHCITEVKPAPVLETHPPRQTLDDDRRASTPVQKLPPNLVWGEFQPSSCYRHVFCTSVDAVVEVRTTHENITTNTVDFTPWDTSSGLYITVLEPSNGRLMMQRVLMTQEFGSSLELPAVLQSISSGRILVLAIKNDAALNLSKKSRVFLQEMGVSVASDLQFRQSLAWVGTVGGRVWAEATILERRIKTSSQWSSPVTLEVDVPRVVEDVSCFKSGHAKERERARFCSLYEGYGQLCSCDNPAPFLYGTPRLENSQIEDVPLIIIASNRPTYLYRCLVTVLRQAGGALDRIHVMVDGHHQEVLDLLKLLQVSYTEHNASGISRAAKISDHYRFSLGKAFSLFSKAPKAILLEEDLLTSPDFFSFFNQTAWLLDEDPTLWCISAWNDLSSLHIAHDPRLLRRVETLPGLGWMITRNVAQELLSKWPSRNKEHDWDLWARSQDVMNGRECVVPDVGRTFHFGLSGAHSPGLLHVAFFSGRPVPSVSYVELHNIHRLKMEEYEEDLIHRLEDDPLYLNTSLHPCHKDFIPRNATGGRPVIIFIDMRTFIDYIAWKIFARCLGLWDMDTRASHRGLYRFFFYETEVFVIGYPFSDYSYLKLPWVNVLEVKRVSSIRKFDYMAPTHRLRFRRPEIEDKVPFWDIPRPRYPTFDETQMIT